jgi:hypothetical protein
VPWWLAAVSYDAETADRVSEAGFRPALFVYQARKRSRGRISTTFLPMYPNYLFVRAEGAARTLVAVRGVHGLVQASRIVLGNVSESEAAEVRDSVVDALTASGDAMTGKPHCWVVSERFAPESKFRSRDVVQSTDARSIWYECRGTVDTVMSDGRIVVLFEMMGRKVPSYVFEENIVLVSRPEARRFRKRNRPSSGDTPVSAQASA